LADSVYETVLEGIVSGSLAAGVELNEVALARQLDVSRTPVHEAVRRLMADGLVVMVGHRRLQVAALTRDEIGEIYSLRQLLEGAAAERAASRIETSVLEELRRAADLLDADHGSLDWPSRALDFDLAFHDAIAAASGNERLRRDIARYRLLVRGLCRMTGSEANLREALEEHRTILIALERRDPLMAREAMTAHIAARLGGVHRAMGFSSQSGLRD
jgi:DNA-binding GntR family transcriptional regulator